MQAIRLASIDLILITCVWNWFLYEPQICWVGKLEEIVSSDWKLSMLNAYEYWFHFNYLYGELDLSWNTESEVGKEEEIMPSGWKFPMLMSIYLISITCIGNWLFYGTQILWPFISFQWEFWRSMRIFEVNKDSWDQ